MPLQKVYFIKAMFDRTQPGLDSKAKHFNQNFQLSQLLPTFSRTMQFIQLFTKKHFIKYCCTKFIEMHTIIYAFHHLNGMVVLQILKWTKK